VQFAHTICTILHTIWAGILDHVQKKSNLQEHVVLEGNTISSDLKSEKIQDVRRESYLLASNFTDSRVLLRFAESSICYETGPTSAGPILQFLIFLYFPFNVDSFADRGHLLCADIKIHYTVLQAAFLTLHLNLSESWGIRLNCKSSWLTVNS